MRNVVFVFTGSYPYSAAAENTFLPQEVAVLARLFDRVVLVPMVARGSVVSLPHANVRIDASYSAYRTSLPRRAAQSIAGVLDPELWREVLRNAATFIAKPRGLVRAVRAYVDAALAERWANERLAGETNAVAYTWWFEGTTLGLARFGNRVGLPVFTRAHGRDVFEWRHDPPVIPFRRASLHEVRGVFSASRIGAEYMAGRYPEHAEKIRPGLLGIDDPGVANEPSSDGVFRIVSCSVFLPVKRVDLMARGIAAAGAANPGQRFEWTHVGVGPERDAVAALAQSITPSNVRHQIVGYTGPRDLYDFYRTQPADVFMNTSASEGTPVAIMEAIAVGIPVIATSVGGNPEIAGPENGLTVPANPTPADIAAAITTLVKDPERRARMRVASRAKWAAEYAADTNYTKFAERIRKS
jgi:glycosyltransferase involved in cell wall biosynthesis